MLSKEEIKKYLDYKELLYKHLNNAKTNRHLFRASEKGQFYQNYHWWRDAFYCCLPYLEDYPEIYTEAYHNYIDIFKTFESEMYDYKISRMIKNPSICADHYIHARIRISDEHEIWEQSWGNKQNDSVSMILIGIFLGESKGLKIIRNEEDREFIQLIIDYLIAVKPTENPSSDCWEEDEDLRSSTIGLVKLAFQSMKKLGFRVPQEEIDKCELFLDSMLPLETKNRFVDLALLVLPFLDITDDIQSKYIVRNVEKYLLVHNGEFLGVKRYIGDLYYNPNRDANPVGSEPAWVFGNLFLSYIYANNFNNIEIGRLFLDSTIRQFPDGELAEMILPNGEPNDNKPLSWTLSMCICCINLMLRKLHK
jgi:hypothetical protein